MSKPVKPVKPIAALFVQHGGKYFGLEGVDPWDVVRDARSYEGPHPVVAHPPCERWGKFWFGSPLAIKKGMPRKVMGDDGGCFESALGSIAKWGGVIEHPAYSLAWKHFGPTKPPKEGGWVKAGPPDM